MEKCKSCGNDATGTCVKCQQQFCNVHGTRTGQGTPVCFPCLQIERHKSKWVMIYLGSAMALLIGLGVPGVILIDTVFGFIFLGVAIGLDIFLVIKIIQTYMK